MQVSLNRPDQKGQRKFANAEGFRVSLLLAESRGRSSAQHDRNSWFRLVIIGSLSFILLSGCTLHHEIVNTQDGVARGKMEKGDISKCAYSPSLPLFNSSPLPFSPSSPLSATPSAMVFAADGAGNFLISSTRLRQVVNENAVPMRVVTFGWSHGYARIFADQSDMANIHCQGLRLAEEVRQFHQENPTAPIYLVGHSAGCMVVLSAVENLPPGIVERCLLLSPSHTNCYDLRPALANVKKGIHVFYSHGDRFYLNVAMSMMGRTSPGCSQASGRTGYRVCLQTPADLALYSKLYQRCWNPGDRPTGNCGGHFGNYEPAFIRQEMLPLLLRREPTIPSAAEK